MLKFGYSPKVISYNIRKEVKNGRDYRQAIAIAYQHARDSFMIEHPKKSLPFHLRQK